MEELIVKSLDEAYEEIVKGRGPDRQPRKRRGQGFVEGVKFAGMSDEGKREYRQKREEEGERDNYKRFRDEHRKLSELHRKKAEKYAPGLELHQKHKRLSEESSERAKHFHDEYVKRGGLEKGCGGSESGQTKKSIDDVQSEVIEKARTSGAKDKLKRKRKALKYYTKDGSWGPGAPGKVGEAWRKLEKIYDKQKRDVPYVYGKNGKLMQVPTKKWAWEK